MRHNRLCKLLLAFALVGVADGLQAAEASQESDFDPALLIAENPAGLFSWRKSDIALPAQLQLVTTMLHDEGATWLVGGNYIDAESWRGSVHLSKDGGNSYEIDVPRIGPSPNLVRMSNGRIALFYSDTSQNSSSNYRRGVVARFRADVEAEWTHEQEVHWSKERTNDNPCALVLGRDDGVAVAFGSDDGYRMFSQQGQMHRASDIKLARSSNGDQWGQAQLAFPAPGVRYARNCLGPSLLLWQNGARKSLLLAFEDRGAEIAGVSVVESCIYSLRSDDLGKSWRGEGDHQPVRISPDQGFYNCSNTSPKLWLGPNQEIVCFWRQFNPARGGRVVYRFSRDGGLHWSDVLSVYDRGGGLCLASLDANRLLLVICQPDDGSGGIPKCRVVLEGRPRTLARP